MALEEMRILDLIFWAFAGGVCLWILGVWISLLIPRFERPRSRRAASSGGGFAETGFSASLMSHDSSSGDAGSESDSGSDSGGGGEFSGGGGESGGGGSTGSW